MNNATAASGPKPPLQVEPPERNGIWSPSFQGLLWTNWLTAINDNIFRWFVIGVGKTFVSADNHGNILMFGTLCFVLPYLILASPAGWLADRFRKRDVIVACKIAEVVVMILGVVSLLCGSLWMLMTTVALMGAQSALFAPSKIGTIPEILSEKEISKGNGIFALATLSAVIIGMGIGNKIADIAGPQGQQSIWLTALVLIGVAVVGTVVSLVIRARSAANPTSPFPVNFLAETWRDIVDLSKRGPLFRVALGTIFFLSIAGLAQINIDAFADESGSIDEFEKLPLLVSLVMGVGVGSVIAGFVSGSRIELGLVPLGAAGMVLFLVALAFTPASFLTGSVGWGLVVACVLLAGLGVSAGFFDVPLNAYLQHKSPVQQRGRILSATNCLMFTGVAVLSLAFGGLRFGYHKTETTGLEKQVSSLKFFSKSSGKIEAAVSQFKSNWSSQDDDPVARVLASNPFPVAAAADHVRANYELIYADAKQRLQANESIAADAEPDTVTDNDYRELFDATGEDSRRSLKTVIRRASSLPLLSSRQIFFLMGLLTVPVLGFALWRLSRDAMRLAWSFMFRCLYRVKIVGMEKLPQGKPAVLVVNHSSWLDGPLVLSFIPQPFRVIAWAGNFNNPVMKKWAEYCRIILITGGPKSIREAFRKSRVALDNNEWLGLFPEGGISPNCQVRSLKPGLIKILQDRQVPIIPVYMDQLWGSIFSYSEGKAIWKLPRSIRRPLCITIGDPVEPQPTDMVPIRQSMQALSTQAVSNYVGPFRSPVAEFVTVAKRQKFQFKVGDTLKQEATGGMALGRALILRRLLRRLALADGEQHVGVLIPPTVGGTIVNLALSLDKRVAINLNYSLSNDLMNHCIHEAGIKHVLTTKKVMEKFSHFELDAELVYLDDFKEEVGVMDKVVGLFQAFAVPGSMLCRLLGLNSIKPDDLMTIVFTSGSTGVPKGVMLSHQNVLMDVRGFEKAARFVKGDVIVGILPFFHSFGYTITLWGAMMTPISGAYHVNPLDAKQIGKMVEKFKGTILMSTPTFLRSYMRRCTTEQFATLNTVVTGAERLPPELADQYEEKFGVRPVQGYGITELSPAVCANIPGARRQESKFQVEFKPGTVGRPIANVMAIVRDLDTDQDLGPNEEGMLWVSGPTVMLGYLNKPEATAEVVIDGWFKTGDMGKIDEDGFITITGRLSRFSKIGGEMVPHLAVEEVLSKLLDLTPDDDSDDNLHVAVTSVADEKKGERLVVLYTVDHKTPDEMREALKAEGLPNIFIPAADSFHRVEKLPILGTGKLDLRGIKDTAKEIYNQ